MAITEIWSVKNTPGKTLDYVSKSEKSEDGTLVFSHQCSTDPVIADIQMRAHRERFGKDSKVKVHHGFVSFPGQEMSPEQALEFAQEWMDGAFSGYQYFCSVHVDTDNIHFNFIINSVGLDGKKYNRCDATKDELRAWTDELCEKNQLSIVIPKDKGMSYKEWMEQKNGLSWKESFREDIDFIVSKSEDYEEFLAGMKELEYFVKGEGENYVHIVYMKDGHRVRGGTLSKGMKVAYTREAIKERIRLKEFNLTALNPSIRLRKNRKKISPLQRELMRLKGYRKPTLATTLALGVHLLAGTIDNDKRPSRNQKKWRSEADRKIYELSRQLIFVEEHQIKNRADIALRTDALQKQIKKTEAELRKIRKAEKEKEETDEAKEKIDELKLHLREAERQKRQEEKLLKQLDEIRDGSILTEPVSSAAKGGERKEKQGDAEKENRNRENR